MQHIKVLMLAIVLACTANTAFAQKNNSQEAAKQLYSQALDLFQKEKYASAQNLFDRLVAERSSNEQLSGHACYYAGVCAEKLNNNDAEFRLEEYLRLYPQGSHTNMAYFYLGNFHYTRGDYAKALRNYKKVESREVEYGHKSEYNFKVGYCYFNAEDYSEAKKLFQQEINGKSKYTNAALYYYAHLQYVDGKYDLSLRNFQKLQNDKRFAKIVPSYIARIYYYLGKDDELLQMAPVLLLEEDVFKKNEIRQMVAEVYFNRGEYKEALDYYSAALAHRGDSEPQDSEGLANLQGKHRNESPSIVACSPQDSYYQIGYCHYMLHQYDSAAYYLSKKTTCVDSVAQHAFYVLGDVDIKLNRKTEARSMFLQASKMDFDSKVKEDALFNYAKLSYEMNANPYNESIHSFEDYLNQYPRTPHKTEIQEILTSLYFSTRNYKDALSLIEKMPERSAALNQAYQRIVINRGIEVFNTGNMKSAATYFQKAAQINALPKYTADAYYLYAESRYRMGDYDAAGKSLDRFMLASNSTTSPYYRQALYTHGYLCMKREKIDDAADDFKMFIRLADNKIDEHQVNDAYCRLADCQYLSRYYQDAISNYNHVIDANDIDADYATYQKALSYGALGKYAEKMTFLNQIFEKYKSSPLAPKALFEIGNTYLVLDNNEQALTYYNNFLSQYPNSIHVKTTLLNMGLIYYNTDRNDEALEVFDRLLTNYAGTDEARDALSTVKNIYISQNRVSEYFSYVQRTTKTSVSTVEQDSTTYMSAENLYMDGQSQNAIKAFENYLEKFPDGLFCLKAHYYAADCLFSQGQTEKALPHYEAVASAGRNSYTERSLLNGANIAYSLNNFTKALDLYEQLVGMAESDNSILTGRIGILRSWVRLAEPDSIISAAKVLLKENKITGELRDEARICLARCYYQNPSTYAMADSVFALLNSSSNGDYSGEAYFCQAEMRFLQKDYDASERVIEAITAEPPSDYWLAKSFILWADIFHARGNNLQAKQTLQSIIDNYDGDDLVALALQKRNAILEEEGAQQQTEEEEIVIELDATSDQQ